MPTTTRVYTAGPDGRCTVCQRPEAEHEPQAWSETPRACPPVQEQISPRYAMQGLMARADAAGDASTAVLATIALGGTPSPELMTSLSDDAAWYSTLTPTEASEALSQPTNTLRAMRLCPRCERPLVDHNDDGACPEVSR